ncbi:uncharacterized protein LOC133548057 isoform X1 [Nerophis ophidion]|uniref:uncharacterized protein LOC133548057 isoform X1 n=2 Tax=Nerophis ophidion TaxID=159077 RepID=UPI002ADFCAB2|nr:uncharacterized protein LOC133548057 isoform X1 [Nerophis ophidion]
MIQDLAVDLCQRHGEDEGLLVCLDGVSYVTVLKAIPVSAQDVKYFLKGQDIHFMPSISERPIVILWQHNEKDVVCSVGTEKYVASSHKNRITLDRVSAELTIKNATYEDSGDYRLQMNINSEQETFLYRIEVIDKVSKPNISCEMSDTKQPTLVCSTESKHPHLLKLKWSSPGKEQTGPNLTITVRNEDDDQVYRCDVSNPLTNETASFTAKDCFPVSAQDVKYFLKGQDIHFMPSISEQPIRFIWLHNENEVVWFTGTEKYVPSSYKNRITLDRVSGELTIKNATYEDSGDYHLGMNINNKLNTFQRRIEVIDKVSKPNISCEMSDTKQATLVCSTESKHPHLLKLKWSSPGKEQTGPNLTITVRNEDDDQVYRCDVSNPLTNETASFTAKDCFLGKRSDVHLIIILVCIFILVILCCVLYITCQYLKVSKERDEKTSFLDQVLTLTSNSGLNVLTEDEKMDSEGAMLLTASVPALHSSSTHLNTITELSDTSNDPQDQQKNSEENVKTDDFLSGATLSDWGGIRKRSNSWSGISPTYDRNVHLKKKEDFREKRQTISLTKVTNNLKKE